MNDNVLGIVFSLLSLIFGGLTFSLLLNIFNRTNEKIEDIEDKRDDFCIVTKELLKTDFANTENTFANDFSNFEEKMVKEIGDIKDMKKKLALKEALSLLKKQDKQWYEKHFSSLEPTDEMIEKVYQTNINLSNEKYTEFIENIKNS